MTHPLDRYFKISELGSSLRTEIFAGLTTYLSLAYILVVNPAILSKAGMDVSAVLFATAVASGLSMILMGFWAKLPFVVAPGLEMNGFFAFAVCGTIGLSWQQGLGAVFWSGVLCVVMTWIPARRKIIDAIPEGLKANIAVSVGVFVLTIALFLSKIVIFESGLPSAFGSLLSVRALALFVGLVIAVLSARFRVPGGMLVAIIGATVLCRINGISTTEPASFSQEMFGAVLEFDPGAVLLDFRSWPVILVLFLIDFYGSIGKFIGLTANTNLQSNGQVRNIGPALYVDGLGTMFGAMVGTSSLITYVESAVGIAAGGRTGIVAIVCGLLMLASLLLTPLVGLVPVEATAGVLVYVGYLLLPLQRQKSEYGRFDLIVGALMGLVSLFTFSLDRAMLLGFCAYTGKRIIIHKDKNIYLIGSTVMLLVSVVSQYLLK
jgi:AGZA family xanthine/uracil permease-like MFS transporter